MKMNHRITGPVLSTLFFFSLDATAAKVVVRCPSQTSIQSLLKFSRDNQGSRLSTTLPSQQSGGVTWFPLMPQNTTPSKSMLEKNQPFMLYTRTFQTGQLREELTCFYPYKKHVAGVQLGGNFELTNFTTQPGLTKKLNTYSCQPSHDACRLMVNGKNILTKIHCSKTMQIPQSPMRWHSLNLTQQFVKANFAGYQLSYSETPNDEGWVLSCMYKSKNATLAQSTPIRFISRKNKLDFKSWPLAQDQNELPFSVQHQYACQTNCKATLSTYKLYPLQ